jgi:hypothetical protein
LNIEACSPEQAFCHFGPDKPADSSKRLDKLKLLGRGLFKIRLGFAKFAAKML